jgi:hypothetical protein
LPSFCFDFYDVYDNDGNYEKTLCYVQQKATYYKARAFCLKHKMRLYMTKSSVASSATITEFGLQVLGGSKKAVVYAYVDGVKGKKCSTVNGAGKTNYDWCSTSYHFVCEYNDEGEC